LNASESIRVIVAEDEEPLSAALCDLIASEGGLEVVGSAASADEAIELAAALEPDVAIVDVRMPGGGPRAACGIRERSPATSVVALSAYNDQATVLEMLRCGAVGYLVKGISPEELLEAIRRAKRGQASFSIDAMKHFGEDLTSDLSGRSGAVADLRATEQRFRALLESAPDAVLIVDAAGQILLVNEQTEALFGYAREELLNKPIETLLPERARKSHVRQRDHYMADPLTRPMGFVDLAARRRDGTEIPVDISLTAIETEDGRLAIAFVRDITARHDAELAIKQLAAIVESSDDAIIGKTLDGTILTWNLGAERMYGYSAAEMVGRPVSVLAPPDLPDELPDLIGRLQRGEEIDQLETKRRRRDGAEIDVLLKLSAIRNGRGEIVGSSSIARDITQLKAQADLERDLAERRALLAHLVTAGEEERARIAGDIHDDSIQAITAAGMRLQILRRKVDDPEQLKLLGELEETIRLSIDRLRHLLFDLRPPILDTEGLAAAVEMYLEDAANGATTRYELEDKLRSQPSAQTRTILYRIVQEALMNVRKHAVAATATVLLQERDGGYLVRIADDGVGFAVDQAKPVLGHLGLASMRERAMLADGWMRVRSAPQDGTTIEVWVPALGPADDESNALASASNGTPTAPVAR
jgi:PAS domain S-box-containing protein